MKLRYFLFSALFLFLFAGCDDGGKKKDKCKNVTCGENAHCDPDTGICVCDDGHVGNPSQGCTLLDLCEDVTCGENATCVPSTGECECNAGYVGDPDVGCTAGPCLGVTCGANATCDDNTGECECDPGYTGDPDAGCVAMGACEANTCNGNGTCDDSSGLAICTCDTGYEGSTCDRCAYGYEADPDNAGKCIHNPCIPDPCYGNGTCSLDADRLPVCECDTGYTGGNCNYCDTANGYMEDPNNAGVCILHPCEGYDCGQGTCSLSGGNPVCTCNTGYTGERCDSCANGYVESQVNSGTCIADPCAGQTCSGHGTCSVNAADQAVCACDTGYAGATCADCDDENHYIPSTVTTGACIVDPCVAIPCGGNGQCSVVDDDFACTCDTGWAGDTCNTCATGYTGADCDLCDTGYVASTLNPGTCIPNPCGSAPCGTHGTCSVVDDAFACTCDTGYSGTTCTSCADGYVASTVNPGTCILNPCTGFDCGDGSCHVTEEDLPSCNCPTGYTGVDCSECDTGYIASTVNPGTCILNPCGSNPCGTHGSCSVVDDAFVCTCDMGYMGETCTECMDEYINSSVNPGTCILNPCTGFDCGNGTCSVNASDAAVCTCDTGYTGATCDTCAEGYEEFPAESGICVDETIVQPGQLIINEILIMATTDPLHDGQWFEVYNTTSKPKRWADLTLTADFATISIPTDSTAIVPANGFMVVGRNPNTMTNGGVTMNQLIPGMVLDTSFGVIEIERTSDGTLIDMVEWDSTWNHLNQRTLNLSPAALDGVAHEINDNGYHWCFGTFNYGDFNGTPGAPNDECRLHWCAIQWPAATSTPAGIPTEPIYAQVYDHLLTVGQDFSPFITAQVGFGPLASDPEVVAWSWFDAAYNPEFTGSNNEEFMGTLIPVETGVFDYLYRVSTDGGLSYQYCEWHDGGGRGVLTVTEPACEPQVVISELYGAGGNTSAIWLNDFVVLHNRSLSLEANLAGWSLQYASATGNTWTNIVPLTGTIAAGGYFLVQLATGTAGHGAPLPTPDLIGTVNMAGAAGKLALVSSTTALSGACPESPTIVDFVGFGPTANCFETAPTTSIGTLVSALRLGEGCIDTDNNSLDFTTSTAAPKNSASTPVSCGCH